MKLAGAGASESAPGETSCDVFVYGSTPSGVAAAVFAARQGCRVVLACPKNHPGGTLASGLCTLDSKRSDVHSSFVFEFRRGIQAAYKKLPKGPGYNTKHSGHEPSVAEAYFADLIATQSAQLDYCRQHYLVSAAVQKGGVVNVDLKAPERRHASVFGQRPLSTPRMRPIWLRRQACRIAWVKRARSTTSRWREFAMSIFGRGR